MKKFIRLVLLVVCVFGSSMTAFAKPGVYDTRVMDPEYLISIHPEVARFGDDYNAMYEDLFFSSNENRLREGEHPYYVANPKQYIILLPQYGIQDTFTAWGESKKYNVGGRRYDIVFEAAIAAELECQRIANEIGFECVIEELIIDDGSDINGIILNGKEFDYFSVTYKNKLISPEGVEFKFSPTVYLRNGEMEISMPGIYEFFVIVSNGGIAIYKGKPHIDTTHYSEKRLLYAEFAQEFAQGKIGYLAPKTGTGKFGLGIGGYDSFDENWGQWYYIDSPIYYYD